MRVSAVTPCAELAPYVRSFTIVETDHEVSRTLLPDTGIVLGIRYSGFARQIERGEPRRLPDASLAGMQGMARQMNTSAHAGIVLATFRPAAAAAFFGQPLHELFGKTAALDLFVPASAIDRVASQVAAAPGAAQRVTAMERLLLDLLPEPRRDRLVVAAVSALSAAHGALRIGQLARDLQISRDRLERRFRYVVGMRPKQFASLLRVRRAIELHRSGSSLTRAAVEAGYCDQSHFIRDFKLVTGEAPRRFLSATQHC